MNKELKPCSCGTTPKTNKYNHGYEIVECNIYCPECGRETGFVLKEKAIEAWNRRVTDE